MKIRDKSKESVEVTISLNKSIPVKTGKSLFSLSKTSAKTMKSGYLILISLLLFFQYVNYAHCTSLHSPGGDVKEVINEGRGITSESGIPEEISRKPKLLKELTMLNRQSCLSKILCGVEVAKQPSSSTSTINDYAYLVKNFFDQFSSDSDKNGLEQDDNNSDEDDDESESDRGHSPSFRKNSKQPSSDHEDTMSIFGDKDLDKLYDMPLESMLDEEPFSLGFKRRGGRTEDSKRQNSSAFVFKVSYSTPNHTDKSLEIHPLQRGLLGFYNPRFDKTAFLNHKQTQLKDAQTDGDKLKISAEIAAKLRSPRQCRLLSWLTNPTYTTTTTITTTSNNPGMIGPGAVNTMCPFSVEELQKMILNGQTTANGNPQSTSAPAPVSVGSVSTGSQSSTLTVEQLKELQKLVTATVPPKKINSLSNQQIQAILASAKPTHTQFSYGTKRPYTIRTTIIPPQEPSQQSLRDDLPVLPPSGPSRPPPQVFNRKRPQTVPYLPGSSSYYRPEDDEKLDVLGNPHGDIVPSRFQYKSPPPTGPGPMFTEQLNFHTLPPIGRPPPTRPPWVEMNVKDEIPEHMMSQPIRNHPMNKHFPGNRPTDYRTRPGGQESVSGDNSEESSEEKSGEVKNEEESKKSEEEKTSKENEDDGKSDEEESSESEEKKPQQQKQPTPPRPSRPLLFNMAGDKEEKPEEDTFDDEEHLKPKVPVLPYKYAESEEVVSTLGVDESGPNEEVYRPQVDNVAPYKPQVKGKDEEEDSAENQNPEGNSTPDDEDSGEDEDSKENDQLPPKTSNKESSENEEDSKEQKPLENVREEDSQETDDAPREQPSKDDASKEDESKEQRQTSQRDEDSEEQTNAKDDSNEDEVNKEDSVEDKKDLPEDSEEQRFRPSPSQPPMKANDLAESEEASDLMPPSQTVAEESEEDDDKAPQQKSKEQEESRESDEDNEGHKDESKEDIEDPTDVNEESEESQNEVNRNKRGDTHKAPPPPPPPSSERGILSFIRGSSKESKESKKQTDTTQQQKVSSKKPASPESTSSEASSSTSPGNSDRGGLLSSILSNHGKHTFNKIQTFFGYGHSDTDMLPPPPGSQKRPPKPNGPPRRRRKKPNRRRPGHRPHHDQSYDDEDTTDDDSEEDDEPKKKKKVTTTTTTPSPAALPHPYAVPALLYPFYRPPTITPLVIEDNQSWEGKEKPHDNEEFFEKEEKPTEKPEKYDYDEEEDDVNDSSGSSEDDSKQEKDNGDRYVSGLPMTWEQIYADMLKKKVAEKVASIKIKPESEVKKGSEEDDEGQRESDESEEQEDQYGPPPPPEYSRRRRPPAGVPQRGQSSFDHELEPIDK